MSRMLTLAQYKETKQRLIWETEKWLDLAYQKYGLPDTKVKISFGLRARTAGRAEYDIENNHYRINYNLILAFENQDAFYNRTVPHEVMHLIDVMLHKESSHHGDNWKKLMRGFGLECTRCHTYNTSNVKRNVIKKKREKFDYVCTCCGSICSVGKKVHNKIKNGYIYYHLCPLAKKLKKPLVFKSKA